MQDNNDREQHEYSCHAPSCHEVFFKAPPAWFEGRGMSEPKFCDTCRSWFRLQESIGITTVICIACGHGWSAPPEYRISYYKRIGDWDVDHETLLCKRCENDPSWRFRQRERLATARLKKMTQHIDVELVENQFGDDVDGALELIETKKVRSTNSFEVPTDIEFYEQTKNFGRRAKHGANQLEHIMKRQHQWKEKLGMEDPKLIIPLAAEIAGKTSEHIAEMRGSNGNILKCDARSGLVVIIKPDAASETGHSIETAYMTKGRVDLYLQRKLQ